MHFPLGERLYFLDPRMRLIPNRPPPSPPLPPEPVETLVRQNRLRDVEPGFLTSAARYKREDDIPLAVVMRALRALEEMGHSKRATRSIRSAHQQPRDIREVTHVECPKNGVPCNGTRGDGEIDLSASGSRH